MTADDLILAAARLLTGPESYTRKHAAALENGEQTAVCDKRASSYSMTGLIERAASIAASVGDAPTKLTHRMGNRGLMADAKSIVCKRLGTVHLDYWEARTKPTWLEVKAALEG